MLDLLGFLLDLFYEILQMIFIAVVTVVGLILLALVTLLWLYNIGLKGVGKNG